MHPDIAKRTVEKLTASRAMVSERAVRPWFIEIETYLEQNNLLGILNDPSRIFNVDESGFMLCPKTEKVS